MIKTLPFTTNSGDYLSILMGIWIPRYGWAVALPLIVCAAIGLLFDVRFLFIALMLLFIVIPMLMSFLYTYYMLTSEARRAVTRKEVEIDDNNGVKLVYLPPEKPVFKEPKLGEEYNNEEIEVKPFVPEPETIKWEKVKSIKYTSKFVVYILDTPRLQFLLIPYTALPKHK
ncbi:MAG: hypothetical protein NC453_08235 [Muribaculum sp.]|nr:hypothetical protein [Muribaculum sp.]